MEDFELEPGEKIIKVQRKHWFVFLLEFIPYALLALIPFVIPSVLHFIATSTPADSPVFTMISTLGTTDLMENQWVRAILGIWWLAVWLTAFNVFTNYFLEAWLVTTERIVFIDQKGFFRREVSSLLLDRVQDVTTDVSGFFATTVDFGNIHVQTAGTEARFHMTGIPDAKGMRDIILRQVTLAQEKSGGKGQGGL